MKIFSIYDSKADAYATPFFFKRDGEAIRAFTQLANDNNSQVGKFPSDYTLFELGEYDETTGVITPVETPRSLGLAQQFIEE
jgi:hypothetical protein